MTILVGCDPEVFVKQGGMFKSAHGLIKGDKKSPQPVRNGAVQVDGMALEFNINPAATEREFVLSVQDVFAQMCAMVPDYEVVAVPVAEFTEEYMKQQPEEAKELGCDPDFNAWANGRANDKPDGDRPFRTASGHVHIGWTNGVDIDSPDHLRNCHSVVKQLDFYLGLPSLMYDQDTKRRSMYGKAGAYRPKSYGVEYRTLSNRWLSSEKLMGWVFRTTQKAVEAVMNGDNLVDQYGDIQHIINTSDVKGAEEIIRAAQLEVAHA